MAIKFDVMAKTGTYTDKEGNEKSRWQKCGVVFEGDKGWSLKLEAIPVGEWNGWFSLFEPKNDKPRPVQTQNEDEPPWP